MASPLYQFAAPTVATMRDNMLRTWANGLIALGVTNPNTSPGSDMYVLFSAVANELAAAYANTVVASDATMPDTALSTDLDRWLKAVGLARNPANGSGGVVTFNSSVTAAPGVFIATGTQMLDVNQLRYQVSVGGNYVNGQSIPVQSVDLGAATNHLNGDTLTWIAGPPYSAGTVLVGTAGGTDGLSGGSDAELDDPARARLFARLQNPPTGGNWSATNAYAEASTPRVEKSFCFPALLGPGTTSVAVTARATPTNRSRQLDNTTVLSTVLPYLQAQLPEHTYSTATYCTNYTTNCAILLSLPSAPTASPAGPGGGWLDGSPWPSSVYPASPVTVTAVTDTTHLTVNATTPPTAGVTQISYLDPTTWTLYSAVVTSYGGSSGAYTLVLSAPLINITTGCYIFPTSQNQAVYVNALLNAFAAMGPGEKTASLNVLPRAYRHPQPTLSWPSALGPYQLHVVELSAPEVLSATWLYRLPVSPPTADPPNILYPNFVGFYAA